MPDAAGNKRMGRHALGVFYYYYYINTIHYFCRHNTVFPGPLLVVSNSRLQGKEEDSPLSNTYYSQRAEPISTWPGGVNLPSPLRSVSVTTLYYNSNSLEPVLYVTVTNITIVSFIIVIVLRLLHGKWQEKIKLDHRNYLQMSAIYYYTS